MGKKVLERIATAEITVAAEFMEENNAPEEVDCMIYDKIMETLKGNKMFDWITDKFADMPTHIDLRIAFVEQPYRKEDPTRTLKLVFSGLAE